MGVDLRKQLFAYGLSPGCFPRTLFYLCFVPKTFILCTRAFDIYPESFMCAPRSSLLLLITEATATLGRSQSRLRTRAVNSGELCAVVPNRNLKASLPDRGITTPYTPEPYTPEVYTPQPYTGIPKS